tara:strand:+ start:172 stop:1071 length:900 start_codon:yes stop_codon:yes gene_type:complete
MRLIPIIITLCIFINPAFCQTTSIPDIMFENQLIILGLDTAPANGSVLTSNISGITSLTVSYADITDLAGIEGFTSLDSLKCSSNQLISLNLSQNTALTYLSCDGNELTSLDVSHNTNLTWLNCGFNQLSNLDLTLNSELSYLACHWNPLTSLDLTNNLLLEHLNCNYVELASLDLSKNSLLTWLNCGFGELECLNLKNGNNLNITTLYALQNPNLTCIEVDDSVWATNNLIFIDLTSSFSEYCNNSCSSIVGLNELSSTHKQLIGITDLIGREVDFKLNTPLIYIYSDGTTAKVFEVE